MELDLWIPHHRVGLEYQGDLLKRWDSYFSDWLGEQHYYNVDSFGPSSGTGAYSERDFEKINLCESQGISFIGIPYWYG